VRFLVTGASGFVGGHLCDLLRDEGHDLVTLSRDGDVDYSVDVTDAAGVTDVFRSSSPDGVFHLAAIAFVPDAARDAALAERVNVAGTCNVLDAARTRGVRVVVVSSGAVYGDGADSKPPFDESSPLSPRGVYAETKARAESECVQRHGRQPIVRVRAFNHTGPRQSEEYVCSGFAEQVAAVKLGLREPMIRVGDLSAERDFCDVRDTVRAYLAAFERGRAGDVYNVCSGVPRTIRSVLDRLIAAAGVAVEVHVDAGRLRSGEASRLWGCNAKAKGDLCWSPMRAWEQTLEDLLDWWCERLASSGPGR
jgi:GDP-4-dehydro-6-deoxy-D-mannose reductase